MEIMTWNSLFGVPTGKRNPKRNLKNAQWRTLNEDTLFNGYEFAKGSEYKIFETENFGYVVFKQGTKCPNGNVSNKLIHRY